MLGALPAFGVWSGDMVLEDSLFVTEEQGLFDLVYSYVSPDGCLSEGFATAQVVAVPEPNRHPAHRNVLVVPAAVAISRRRCLDWRRDQC